MKWSAYGSMTSRLVCSSVPAAVKMVAESVVRFTTKALPVHVGVHLEIPGHIEAVSGADGGHDHA